MAHPLVTMTREAAKGAGTNHGRLVLRSGLDVRVSRKHLGRALQIMSALLKGSEKMGWHWRINSDGTTLVERDGTALPIALREYCPKRLLASQQIKWLPEYDWVSTGELTLLVDSNVKGAISAWRDTPTKRLEDRLDDAIAGFDAVADVFRASEAVFVAIQRARHEASEREQAAQRVAAEAEAFRTDLLDRVTRWKQAQDIRAYCVALGALDCAPGERAVRDAWIAAALEAAKRTDPLA